MTRPQGEDETLNTEPVRLQKVLAQAGLGSRRACENLISAGRVSVDGQQVTALGTRVDPEHAVVRVDGQVVAVAPDRVYLALNKPRGVLSTMSDDRGRPCVGDLVAGQPGEFASSFQLIWQRYVNGKGALPAKEF